MTTYYSSPMTFIKNKVAIFFANYGPYHIARLEGFCQVAEKSEWEVIPIEITRSGIEYEWENQVNKSSVGILSVLGDQEPQEVDFFRLTYNLFLILQQKRPTVVAIAGYYMPAMILTFLWCKFFNIPSILFSESKEDDAPRIWLNEKIKSLLVKSYSAVLVGGDIHRRYLLKLGMPKEAIFIGYNVVNNRAFSPEHISHLTSPINKSYFLSINRFIPRKNLLFLIEAYAKYRSMSQNPAELVLCGSGELLSEIRNKIFQFNLEDNIYLPGFLQQEQLLPYFAHANCFIHASLQEQWGLVVNEAMAAGLPVLVSNRCGCFEDLVIEGINGYGFDPENVQELADLMLNMSSDRVNLKTMGKASLEHIQKYSPNYFAQGLKQAINYALTR